MAFDFDKTLVINGHVFKCIETTEILTEALARVKLAMESGQSIYLSPLTIKKIAIYQRDKKQMDSAYVWKLMELLSEVPKHILDSIDFEIDFSIKLVEKVGVDNFQGGEKRFQRLKEFYGTLIEAMIIFRGMKT